MASANAFDAHMSTWKAEQDQPWTRLRYQLEHKNIHRHIRDGPLQILDAGGGNAYNAIPFAREGHKVTVVDLSAEMLADGRRTADADELAGTISFHQADIQELPDLYPEPSFDLVLCHNVIQYADDIDAVLQALVQPLKSGGFLSLVTINGYAEVYRAAFRELDLEKAGQLIGVERTVGTLFKVPMRNFRDAELILLLEEAGCSALGLYGVRCVCDWLPNEPKYDPKFIEKLEDLEFKLADRYPYYLLARFFQVIGRKRD